MSFYQNPFFQEYKGNLVLGDRQCNKTFTCPLHSQRGHAEVISVFANSVYDLTVSDPDTTLLKYLTINFATDPNLRYFSSFTVDTSAAAAAATQANVIDIVNGLNANTTFASYFTANLLRTNKSNNLPPTNLNAQANALFGSDTYIKIISKLPPDRLKFYISNTGAETILRFNARAGVAELPTYFDRHTVANLTNSDFPDCIGLLIALDPSLNVDAAVIDKAVDAKGVSKGFDHNTVQADYELLRGDSGLFMFQKITHDSAGNIAQIIEYPAGAKVGDFARKINYWRNGGALGSNPYQITEEPYTLQTADMLTPDDSEATDWQQP